jgi:hypothetical protein
VVDVDEAGGHFLHTWPEADLFREAGF